MSKKQKDRKTKQRQYGSAKQRADTHKGGFGSKCVKVPDGMGLFKPSSKPGVHKIDILPYEVGEGNQLAEKGMLWYERTFHVHNNVGPKKERYICPAMTFNKRCPICETRARLQREPGVTKEQLKACNTSERQLFLVKEYDPKTDKPGPTLLWDMSYHLFGKLLDDRVRKGDDEDELDSFFKLDTDGKTLKIGVEDKTMGDGGKPFANINSIDFKKRRHAYDEEEIVAENPCLDDLLVETSYKDLKDAWNAGVVEEEEEEDEDKDDDDTDDEDEDEDERPSKKKAKKKKEEDDDDADDDDEEDENDNDEDEDEDGEDADEDLDEDEDGDDDSEEADDSDDDDEDEDEEAEDEDEDDGNDDDDGDEDEDEHAPVSVGDKVTWKYKNKDKKGKVTKVNAKTKIVLVKVAGEDKPAAVDFEDLLTVNGKPPKKGKTGKKKHDLDEDEDDDFFDEDEDEDEDDAPKKKKKKK